VGVSRDTGQRAEDEIAGRHRKTHASPFCVGSGPILCSALGWINHSRHGRRAAKTGFTRKVTQAIYGIPSERVVGSSTALALPGG
jgi:hypothetical protein